MSIDGWIYGHRRVSEAFQFSLYSDDRVKDDCVSNRSTFRRMWMISVVLGSIRSGGFCSRRVCQVGGSSS